MTRCPFSSCPEATSEWACTLLTWLISSGRHTSTSSRPSQLTCQPDAVPPCLARLSLLSLLLSMILQSCHNSRETLGRGMLWCRQGSALDEEAQARATSVYLVQKVIPMLPRLLCEKLCSLNPGKPSSIQPINQFTFPVFETRQGIQGIQSSCISHTDWWSVELNAGQSLVVVQETPVVSVDYILGRCCLPVEQSPGTSVELRLGLCVANLEQPPRTSAACAAWHSPMPSWAGQHCTIRCMNC